MQVTTITQKGQVTIPVDIRKYLKVGTGDRVVFEKRKNQVVVKPARNLLDLRGSVPSNKIYSDQKADKAISNYIKAKYGQENTGT